jgi:hypothetical protein
MFVVSSLYYYYYLFIFYFFVQINITHIVCIKAL